MKGPADPSLDHSDTGPETDRYTNTDRREETQINYPISNHVKSRDGSGIGNGNEDCEICV